MASTSGASFSAQKPFFRYDLQTTAVEEGGQRYVDVSCPDTGSSFRFFEVEYAVACGMDGERDLSGLVAWAQAELDLRTNTEEVGAILEKLSELNFVAQPVLASAPLASAPLASAPLAPAPLEPAPLAPIAAQADDAVELGQSGRSPMSRERPVAPAVADDLELGLAGASAVSNARAAKPADSGLELGVAGNESVDDDFKPPSDEVSTDLSQTFRIDKNDVQAAVRASKIMTAVEIPEDLKAEMDKMDQAEAASASAQEGADLEFQIGLEAETSTGREAIVLPEEPAKVAKREAAEALAEEAAQQAAKVEKAEKKKSKKPERRNSASMVLWLLLLAAVGAGAAYYYMEYVKAKPDEVGASDAAKRAAQKRSAPVKVEPVAPTAKLVLGEVPLSEAKAGQAGIVEFVAEPGSEVAVGDVIVKLSGYERFEREIAKHESSMASYQTRLEAAQARGEATKIAVLEKDVARKQGDVAAATAKRDAFFIKAETSGVVEAEGLVEARARVAVDQVVAKVSGTGSATVQFQLPAGITLAVGDERSVVDLADAELTASCTVTEIVEQLATLSCPTDSGLRADAEVKLAL